MVLLLSVLLFLAELVFWAGVGRAGFLFARTRISRRLWCGKLY